MACRAFILKERVGGGALLLGRKSIAVRQLLPSSPTVLPNEKSYRPWSKANCFGAVQHDDKAQLKSVSVRTEARGARQDGQSAKVCDGTNQYLGPRIEVWDLLCNYT